MRITGEESFGPVLSVIPYGSDADAIRIADDSGYGLSGPVWTMRYRSALDPEGAP